MTLLNTARLFVYGMSFVVIGGCQQLTPTKPDLKSTAKTDISTTESNDDSRPTISKLPVVDPAPNLTLETIQLENAIKKYEWQQNHQHASTQQSLVYAPQPLVTDDVWKQLEHHLFLAPAHTEQYKSYIKYYLKRPNYLKRVSIRAKPYLYHVLQEVKKRNMPYEIVLLPIVESGYYPFARSYVDASGLWQFMPATGYMYGLKKDWWYDGRQDVIKSTDAALTYLQKLYVINDYDWLLALASYNGGFGNVSKAKKKYLKKNPNGTPNFWNIRKYLPKETRHYVPQLLAISHLVGNQKKYQLKLEPIANQPFFVKTTISRQLDLVKVAQTTDSELKLIEALNPGFLRKATPPKGQYELLLPKQTAHNFIEQYQQNPKQFKVNWAKHKIKSGESLSVIAANYRTSVKEIKKLNGMKTNRIRSGKTLLIPVPENYAQSAQKRQRKTAAAYNGRKHYHTVKNGESLWSIARYYNVSTRRLCEWNRISIRQPLAVGKKLEIRSNKYGKKLSYTLKQGESLWTVAQKYSVTTTELCHWNGIRKSQILQPGTKIEVWIKG